MHRAFKIYGYIIYVTSLQKKEETDKGRRDIVEQKWSIMFRIIIIIIITISKYF